MSSFLLFENNRIKTWSFNMPILFTEDLLQKLCLWLVVIINTIPQES